MVVWLGVNSAMNDNYQRRLGSHQSSSLPVDRRWNFWSRLLVGYVLLFFALAMLGMFPTQTRPLDANTALWSSIFAITVFPWICLFLSPGSRANWRIRYPLLKRIGLFLVGIAGIGLIHYMAAFGGIPKLFHHAVSSPGTLETTITAKEDWIGRIQKCRTRVRLENVSWFFHSGICVSSEFFESVRIGDSVRVSGIISAYAVAPARIELIRSTKTVRPVRTLSATEKRVIEKLTFRATLLVLAGTLILLVSHIFVMPVFLRRLRKYDERTYHNLNVSWFKIFLGFTTSSMWFFLIRREFMKYPRDLHRPGKILVYTWAIPILVASIAILFMVAVSFIFDLWLDEL